jgi:ribulose-5-phosphate 4-epimerase/fuculose-1-phosphate aldolase
MTTLEMQPASAPKFAAMHPDEWQARVQLAACYRIFDMLGWTEMIYNHITLRVPESVHSACITAK